VETGDEDPLGIDRSGACGQSPLGEPGRRRERFRFANVAGVVLTGRGEFEQLQARTHAMQFKESVRTVTGTDIKFLTPDIAVAHVRWGMRGDKDPEGTPRPPCDGVMLQVFMKRDGKWAVVAAQNTNVK
jgi:uncharacterized protein (TIGR02246 family)